MFEPCSNQSRGPIRPLIGKCAWPGSSPQEARNKIAPPLSLYLGLAMSAAPNRILFPILYFTYHLANSQSYESAGLFGVTMNQNGRAVSITVYPRFVAEAALH